MTVSRYTPETFLSPGIQSHEKRGLDKQGGTHRVAKDPESQSLDSRSLLEIILVDDTSGDVVTHAYAWRGWGGGGGGGIGETYIWQIQRAPSCLPSLLTLMAQGHTPGIIIFIPSRMSVCLPVRLSRTSVPFFLSTFVSSVWPCTFSRGNLFSDAFEGSPWSEPLSLPHTRETGLLVFCARHVTESPRGRLCCRDITPPALHSVGLLSTSFARTKSGAHCNYTLRRASRSNDTFPHFRFKFHYDRTESETQEYNIEV